MENKMGSGTICCLKKEKQVLLAWKTKKLCKDKWKR